MSLVTNIIVAFGCGEETSYEDYDEGVIQSINKYFVDGTTAGTHQRFPVITNTDWYGGSKCLETGLVIGAFNYLNLEEFIEHLRKLPWNYPEEVQVIVKEQEDDKFRIIDVFPEKPEIEA